MAETEWNDPHSSGTPQTTERGLSRRGFLGKAVAASTAYALPTILP